MSGMIEVGKATISIIPNMEGAQKSITQQLGSIGSSEGEKAGGAFSNAFSGGLGKLGKVLGGLGLGVTVGKFAKDSVKAGMEFDSAMSQVAATMGTTVDQIGALRDYAKEMGASTAFSATQSAEALNYMALAGYDAKTSMEMLPNVLNLAAAGGMELASASDMITDSQSALGLSLEETTALVDKMAATASTTNTSVEQLGSALLTVGGTAKNLTGGTTEAAQALGLLADNGIKGAEGGTALRNVILGLSSDKFAKTFGDMGVSVYDAEGKMRSLKDIFGDMNTAMEGMTVEEKTNAISSAFNKVDLKSVNALLGTNAERWDEVAASIDDSQGAAQAMADTQLDNLQGDVTIFKSALEGLQISLSDAVSPALRAFVQLGTTGLTALTNAMSTITSVVGPIFTAVFQSIASIGKEVGEAFTGAFKDIGGISAAGDAMSSLKNILKTVGSALKPIANTFGALLRTVLPPLARLLGATLGTAFKTLARAIDVGKNALNRIKTVINAVKNAFQTFKRIVTAPFRFLSGLKIPKISISGGKAPWGIGGAGVKPSIDVHWAAKGMILDKATLIGAGEAGREGLIPLEGGAMRPFAEAIANEMSGTGTGGIIINLNYNASDDANDMVTEIARGVKQLKLTGAI